MFEVFLIATIELFSVHGCGVCSNIVNCGVYEWMMPAHMVQCEIMCDVALIYKSTLFGVTTLGAITRVLTAGLSLIHI